MQLPSASMGAMPRSRGFSLIELMIALVAGLIVSYAVVAFAMASMKSNAEYVQSTKLTQSLRNSLDLIVRDLRRAGYDELALTRLAGGNTNSNVGNSPFTKVLLNNSNPSPTNGSCILYAYDRTGGTGGTLEKANGEIRGLRRVQVTPTNTGFQVGVIEYAVSNATDTKPSCTDATAVYTTYPPTCNGNWCPLTDASTVNIRAFQITQTAAQVGTDPTAVAIRNMRVELAGRLVGDDTVSYLNGVSTSYRRGLRATVKMRSDCINATISNCDASP